MNGKIEVSEIELESSNKIIDELRQRIEKLESKQFPIEEKLNKNEIIKKRTKELLEVSTCHGLTNILRTKSLFIIVMWSAFTILSACFGSYYVIKSTLDYLKYSTFTKIELINEKRVPFPAISLCAMPSFKTSLDETVLISRFNDILEANTSQYYEEYDDQVMGKCFRFNSGRNIYNQSYEVIDSTIGGPKYGFRLSMKVKVQENNDYGEIYMFIHNKSFSPLDAYSKRGFWLITGSWNFFEIDRVFHQKLDAPYSDCLKDVSTFKKNKTLINEIQKENREYAQSDCYYLCSHLFALEESNCNCNSNLKQYSRNCIREHKKQNETDAQKCHAKYLSEFRKKDQYEKCADYCPLECDSMNYIISQYAENIPASGNISKTPRDDYFYKFDDYIDVKKGFLAIRVFYNELKYTLISEEPKTEFFSFISNIGGILGLFLGISFLSFIEIFEILFEIFIIFLK